MAAFSRREFLKKAAADAAVAGFLAAGVAELRANPLGLPIGSQTYPHRAMIKEEFSRLAEDARRHRRAGGRAVLAARIRRLRRAVQRQAGQEDHRRSRPQVCERHFSMRELREKQAESIAWAKDVGITQMITASLGGGNNPTMDDVKRAADEYNRIAAVAAKAGIQQGLHNEGFEVSMVDGKRTYESCSRLLDPKLVKFQFQMSTISQGFVAAGVLHEVPGPFLLDARAGHGPERRDPAEGARGVRSRSARAASTGSRPSPRRRSAASRTTSSSRPWS